MPLTELYQEVLLDHNRSPRNFGELADANRVAHGHNPLCGDRFTVYVKINAAARKYIALKPSAKPISSVRWAPLVHTDS